jgi:hypothetical protein
MSLNGRDKCARLECMKVLPDGHFYQLAEDPRPKRHFCSNDCAALARDRVKYVNFLKKQGSTPQ